MLQVEVDDGNLVLFLHAHQELMVDVPRVVAPTEVLRFALFLFGSLLSDFYSSFFYAC